MDTWIYLSQGFAVAMTPENLVIALIGCFVGTIVGLLPGLGPINGVAILLPLAFALHLPAESALILLATVYIGCEYGGRISSILLNVPGDAAAIMTALDGYPMAQQGKGGVALSISAVSSFFGSLIAIGGIILFAPLLAQWSLAFGPAEYFALMVFAIACLGSMMAQNPLKSFLAALIGLGLATVGVDANTGVYRFTFDSVHLSDGVQFIVVVIGLFSVSEILLMLEHTSSGQTMVRKTGRMLFNLKEGAQCIGTTLRSSVIGFFVGVLPGAGATIASAITYMTEKKLSGNSDSFGKGDIRGVAMEGGNSLLLHLDDWEHLESFFTHPLARRVMRWAAPPSKNVSHDVWHPVFDVDQQGRPVMRYIDQFVQPKDFEEGVWLSELSDALETSQNILSVPVPVGKFLLINNLFWLHGRDRFTPHPDLRRELMRQRGYFAYAASHYQTHQ
ncbi:hypothetical protein CG613_10555 [Salmonella enterica]|nr:hypothetical protein [Salmonella enterica]